MGTGAEVAEGALDGWHESSFEVMSRHNQFLFFIESASMVQYVLRGRDKIRSLMTLAVIVEVPTALTPEVAATQFIAAVCERRKLPDWARMERDVGKTALREEFVERAMEKS